MSQRTVAASVVQGLLEFAVSKGASRDVLLAQSEINPTDLDDRDNRIPISSYQALIRAGQALCKDPALSLHFAEAIDMSAISVLGLICHASETMIDAFAQINRYGRLVVEVDSVGEGDRYMLAHQGDALWLVDTRENPNEFPELAEGGFAFMVCGVRKFTKTQFVHEVHLTRAAPAHRCEYERIFKAPVLFNCEWNAMRLDEVWANHKVGLAPRYVFGILSGHANALLESLQNPQSLRGRVEALLMPVLHAGNVREDSIASQLSMSRQTLYRRLKAEGTTFERVLDDLRHKLALHYLSGKKVSVNEVAYLVGFSDRTAFARAFKRWTGQSPGKARSTKA